MAYGKRFDISWVTPTADCRLWIKQAGYTGGSTSLDPAPTPISIRWGEQGRDDLTSPLRVSTARIRFVGDADGEMVEEIFDGGDTEYLVKFWRDTGSGYELEWEGYLATDLWRDNPHLPAEMIELEAIDGLALLENRQAFTAVGTNEPWEHYRLSRVLRRVLAGWDPGLDSPTDAAMHDLPITTSQNWRPDGLGLTDPATDQPFDDLDIYNPAFQELNDTEFGSEEVEGTLDQRTQLEGILERFGLTLMLSGGKWHLRQRDQIDDGTSLKTWTMPAGDTFFGSSTTSDVTTSLPAAARTEKPRSRASRLQRLKSSYSYDDLGQLVVNEGFEEPLSTGWTVFGTAGRKKYSNSSIVSQSGQYFLNMGNGSFELPGGEEGSFVKQNVPARLYQAGPGSALDVKWDILINNSGVGYGNSETRIKLGNYYVQARRWEISAEVDPGLDVKIPLKSSLPGGDGTVIIPKGTQLRTGDASSDVNVNTITVTEPGRGGDDVLVGDVDVGSSIKAGDFVLFYVWSDTTTTSFQGTKEHWGLLHDVLDYPTKLDSHNSFNPQSLRMPLHTPQGVDLVDEDLSIAFWCDDSSESSIDWNVVVDNISIQLLVDGDAIEETRYIADSGEYGREQTLNHRIGDGPTAKHPRGIFDVSGQKIFTDWGQEAGQGQTGKLLEQLLVEQWMRQQRETLDRRTYQCELRGSNSLKPHQVVNFDSKTYTVSYLERQYGTSDDTGRVELTELKDAGTAGLTRAFSMETEPESGGGSGGSTVINSGTQTIEGATNWDGLADKPSSLFAANGDTDGYAETQALGSSDVTGALGFTPADETLSLTGGDGIQTIGDLTTGRTIAVDDTVARTDQAEVFSDDVSVEGATEAQEMWLTDSSGDRLNRIRIRPYNVGEERHEFVQIQNPGDPNDDAVDTKNTATVVEVASPNGRPQDNDQEATLTLLHKQAVEGGFGHFTELYQNGYNQTGLDKIADVSGIRLQKRGSTAEGMYHKDFVVDWMDGTSVYEGIYIQSPDNSGFQGLYDLDDVDGRHMRVGFGATFSGGDLTVKHFSPSLTLENNADADNTNSWTVVPQNYGDTFRITEDGAKTWLEMDAPTNRTTISSSLDVSGPAEIDGDLDPTETYAHNIGSPQDKWLSLHAAELRVSTLVSQEERVTSGGRFVVGRSTELVEAMGSGQGYALLKHNNVNRGDVLHMEARGQVEFLRFWGTAVQSTDQSTNTLTMGYDFSNIVSAGMEIYDSNIGQLTVQSVSGTDITVEQNISSNGEAIMWAQKRGGYEYRGAARDQDGTGANSWEEGDALFNTGKTGEGFIDLYAINSLSNSENIEPGNVTQAGPTIAFTEKSGYGYNQLSDRAAMGNLKSSFGYTSDVYGLAAGDEDSTWIAADPVNGFRVMDGSNKKIGLDTQGNAYFEGEIQAESGSIASTVTVGSTNAQDLASESFVTTKAGDAESNAISYADGLDSSVRQDLSDTFEDAVKDGDTVISGGVIATDLVTLDSIAFSPVESDSVIASINSSGEGITINATNLEIGSATTFSSDAIPDSALSESYTGLGSESQTFRQSSEPADSDASGRSLKEGDLWIDTDDGDKPYTYTGSSWTQAYTTIDGGDITTGTVDADRIQANTALAESLLANTAKITAELEMGSAAQIITTDSSGDDQYDISEDGMVLASGTDAVLHWADNNADGTLPHTLNSAIGRIETVKLSTAAESAANHFRFRGDPAGMVSGADLGNAYKAYSNGYTTYGLLAEATDQIKLNPDKYGNNGKVRVEGDLNYTGSLSSVSDRSVKSEITSISDPLGKATALAGKTYVKEGTEEAGFIAQEVEGVFDIAVSEMEELKGLSYQSFHALWAESIKELKSENDRLRARLDDLESKV